VGVDVDASLSGSVGISGPVAVQVSTPAPFKAEVSGGLPNGAGPIGPVTIAGGLPNGIGPVGPVTLAGIPDTFHFYVEKLPKIQIGVDPVELSIRLKEIPSVRAHVPADFSLGVSILGIDLVCFRLCGEAQVITEPYRPNPCERCGPDPGRTVQNVPGISAAPVLARDTNAAVASWENP
jgi:hypothetical protein